MTVSVGYQITVFLCCTLCGMAVGVLFDVFRILRKTAKSGNVTTQVEDLLFWTLAFCLIFFTLYLACSGEIRMFELGGIGIGWSLYLLLFSRWVIGVSVWVIAAVKRAAAVVVRIVLFPIALLYRILKKPMIAAIRPIRSQKQRICRKIQLWRRAQKKRAKLQRKRIKKV